MRRCIIFLITLYQNRPWGRRGGCPFDPSCSEYTKQAFMQKPFRRALTLSIKRIVRCRPGRNYTHDPLI